MKTYVSLIRIVILLGSIVFSSTALALSPPESVECSVELNLPHNQWRQISLPCDPGNATVNDILADNIPGTYLARIFHELHEFSLIY